MFEKFMEYVKGIDIQSKGGRHQIKLKPIRLYLLKTWRLYHKTFRDDGAVYTLFPRTVNEKRHLAFELAAMYSMKKPMNTGEVPIAELIESFKRVPPDVMGGTPMYLKKVFTEVPAEHFRNLKAVVGGAFAPDKELFELIRKKSKARIYWTYGSTEFLDAFTTLDGRLEDGYLIHQGRFTKTEDGELVYHHSRFKEPIHTCDTGEIVERDGKQFIGLYSIKRLDSVPPREFRTERTK